MQNRRPVHNAIEFVECKAVTRWFDRDQAGQEEVPELYSCQHATLVQPEVKLNPIFSVLMDISVVIVGWNAKHYLELCLESLAGAPPHRSMEIIVVDNASSDGTAEMIEARFPYVKLIRSSENLGFAKGNNVGIRRCQGRYIALVNPDVIVFSGCLDALADFLDQNPKVGNVGPRVLNPDMTHAEHVPAVSDVVEQFLLRDRLGDEV